MVMAKSLTTTALSCTHLITAGSGLIRSSSYTSHESFMQLLSAE
jgi:hypothetical protein